jgi:hypothetical protein
MDTVNTRLDYYCQGDGRRSGGGEGEVPTSRAKRRINIVSQHVTRVVPQAATLGERGESGSNTGHSSAYRQEARASKSTELVQTTCGRPVQPTKHVNMSSNVPKAPTIKTVQANMDELKEDVAAVQACIESDVVGI